MLKALAWKELRELLPLLVVALIAQCYFVSTAVGIQLGPLAQSRNTIPFIGDGYVTWLLIVTGLAAVVFGLWQTLRESSQGTYQFLLHRPARRETIFGTKLAVGGTALAAVALVPILVYALWAAAPGTHASPFQWSMTADAWNTCLFMPLLYLGAFASGLRPARWFGSRLFPLTAALMAFVIAEATMSWRWTSLAVALAAETGFVLVVLYIAAQRDYS